MMRYSAVIPCFNEEDSITRVIESLPREIDEIIVVDNNSKDRTASIAKNLGARVIFEPRQGYGAALKAGFNAARGEIIIALDGDGQHPTEKILGMIDHLTREGADFVSGCRFPTNPGAMNLIRLVGNKTLTAMANTLFGLRLRDSQSGMWVFRRKVLELITLVSDDMSISEEIKIKVATHPRLQFSELQIPYYQRSGSSKLLPFRHGIRNLLFLFALKYDLKKRRGVRMS